MAKGDTLKILGERIKATRSRRGMTQAEVADLTGISKQSYSDWERGNSPPTLLNLIRLATVLEVSVADFLTDEPQSMLAASDPTLLKIAASSKLIPVYGMHVAGGLLMGSIKDVEARPDRFIAAYSLHQDNALAILIKGPVNEPKYKAGGVATMNPGKAPEPGNMVFALASGELHFRRWMPKQHGTLAGSELVACNPAYPPIVMSAGDIILAVMGEYTTSSHD